MQSSCRVRHVVAELLAARKADGASARYLGDMRSRLSRFAATFGDETIAAITAKQINDWLRALPVGGVTRNNFRRRLSGLFSHARRSVYLTASPLQDVERGKERPEAIGILTVAETARLLECASAETLPFWAIGAFCGLRRAELERLLREHVDFESGFIEVTARNSKSASRRHVEMPQNLREWLVPYRFRVDRSRGACVSAESERSRVPGSAEELVQHEQLITPPQLRRSHLSANSA